MNELKGTAGQRRRADELVRLAMEEFGDLEGSEANFLSHAAFGQQIECSQRRNVRWDWQSLSKGNQNFGNLGFGQKIRGVLIEWLCTDRDAMKLVSHSGINIYGAFIEGVIDIEGATVSFPIAFECCAVPDGVMLYDSHILALQLDGSYVGKLQADRLRVDGCVHLRNGFCSTDEVRFSGALIGGNLSFRRGEFGFTKEFAIAIEGCKVDGFLFLDFKRVHSGKVSVAGAQAKIFIDSLKVWPSSIDLTGFQYDSIHPDSLGNLKERLEWLNNHDETIKRESRKRISSLEDWIFNPQPYRQLAKMLRHSGHDRFADEVMFEASKRQAAAQLKQLKENDKSRIDLVFLVWYWLLEWMIGFGYRRWLPLVWMLGFFVMGAWMFSDFDPIDVFRSADPYPGGMQPVQAKAAEAALHGQSWLEGYPVFRPVAYSMDTFLPLVDLHQEKYWTPKDGLVKKLYLPIHILAGWVVTTFAAVSVTGLVRHEKE